MNNNTQKKYTINNYEVKYSVICDMSFNKNNTAEMPSIQRYNCRLYIPPLNKSCICMNFIFDVTIDMAIYNICILICTFKHLKI